MFLKTHVHSSSLIRFLLYVHWIEFGGILAAIINGKFFEVNSGWKIRSDYVIDVASASSRLNCALRCHRNSVCAGINFNSQSKECEICSVPGDSTYVESSSGWDVSTPSGHPTDCYDVLSQYNTAINSVYSVYVPGTGAWVSVYCDMDTDGGGWTVFQIRQNGDVDFNRDFASYRDGFGEPSNEYWLGLEIIHAMTHGLSSQLQLHFVDFLGQVAYEKYDDFSVGAGPSYQLYLGDLIFFNNTQETAGTMTAGTYSTGQNDVTMCQFVNQVLAYSTQWDAGSYSTDQIIGAPDVYPSYGDIAGAWCPGNDKSENDYLVLQVATAVQITRVTIYETYEGGSLTRIATRDQAGQWQTLATTAGTSVVTVARTFSPSISRITEMTTDIRLEMDLSSSWYEIDAVEVCGNQNMGPFQTMKYNDGASFTTSDHDADQSSGNCANIHNGGWWFKDCTSINPNGEYTATGTPSLHNNGLGGLISPGWKGYNTLRETKLMFRRK